DVTCRRALALRRRLAVHTACVRPGALRRPRRTGAGRYERARTPEYAEQGHVSLHKRHVHDPALDEAHELLVNTQPDIGRSKDNSLGSLDLRLLDRDILVQRDTRLSTQEPVHP